jgi:hypothetical protein
MPYGSGGAEGNPRLPNPIRPDTHDSSFVADSDGATSGEESSARIAARKFSDEVWFAKLPPTLRNAIEAKATRPPPRGYEERLRRYFESDER